MKAAQLYLVRHGRTDWNDAGRWQGAVDIPLNETGRAQASVLADALRGRVDAIFASDLQRASETARIVSEVVSAPIVALDPDLRERGYGVFEGLTSSECAERYPDTWAARERDRNTVPPGGEPYPQVLERMERAMQRVVRASHARSLVIGHGSSLRMFLERVIGKPQRGLANLELRELTHDATGFHAL